MAKWKTIVEEEMIKKGFRSPRQVFERDPELGRRFIEEHQKEDLMINSKKFMKQLRNEFPEHKIKMVRWKIKNLQFEDISNGERESISVNGKMIDLCWWPHINKISDPGAVDILYGDCEESVRRL